MIVRYNEVYLDETSNVLFVESGQLNRRRRRIHGYIKPIGNYAVANGYFVDKDMVLLDGICETEKFFNSHIQIECIRANLISKWLDRREIQHEYDGLNYILIPLVTDDMELEGMHNKWFNLADGYDYFLYYRIKRNKNGDTT